MLLFMHASVPEYIQHVPQRPPTDQRKFLTLQIFLLVHQRPLDMYVNLVGFLSIFSN